MADTHPPGDDSEGDGGLYFAEPLSGVERVPIYNAYSLDLAVLAGAHVRCMTIRGVALLVGTLSCQVDRLEALAKYPEVAAKWATQLGATPTLDKIK